MLTYFVIKCSMEIAYFFNESRKTTKPGMNPLIFSFDLLILLFDLLTFSVELICFVWHYC